MNVMLGEIYLKVENLEKKGFIFFSSLFLITEKKNLRSKGNEKRLEEQRGKP